MHAKANAPKICSLPGCVRHRLVCPFHIFWIWHIQSSIILFAFEWMDVRFAFFPLRLGHILAAFATYRDPNHIENLTRMCMQIVGLHIRSITNSFGNDDGGAVGFKLKLLFREMSFQIRCTVVASSTNFYSGQKKIYSFHCKKSI